MGVVSTVLLCTNRYLSRFQGGSLAKEPHPCGFRVAIHKFGGELGAPRALYLFRNRQGPTARERVNGQFREQVVNAPPTFNHPSLSEIWLRARLPRHKTCTTSSQRSSVWHNKIMNGQRCTLRRKKDWLLSLSTYARACPSQSDYNAYRC